MNFETLAGWLSHRDATSSCILTSRTELSAQALQKDLDKLKINAPVPRECRLALVGLTPLQIVQAIIAFDGVVDSMLLLPHELDEKWRDTLIDLARCTHRLQDDGLRSLAGVEPSSRKNSRTATRWILATSGTTGTPKLVEHQLATLARTVRQDPKRGADFVWGLVYVPCRYAGLQVVLQALLSGARLVLADELDFDQQVKVFLQHDVNALSATPSLWRRMMMDGRVANLNLKQITLGGEIVDQIIINALAKQYPEARIVHIYASTEAGTGFSVHDKRSGFPSDWIRTSSNRPKMKISADNHLMIKPPLLPSGSFLKHRLDPQGYLDTQDIVRQEGDRIFFVGRASGVINVGGNKVHPEEVEVCLRAIDGVRDARVFSKPSSILGQLVAAEIVAADTEEESALRSRIARACRSMLKSWQVPTKLTFVKSIKETSAGKVDRSKE